MSPVSAVGEFDEQRSVLASTSCSYLSPCYIFCNREFPTETLGYGWFVNTGEVLMLAHFSKTQRLQTQFRYHLQQVRVAVAA